ncbi:MAG TPA: hypothetical protein VK507_25580, partial [Iamia sp.]|nr:hypothetical protein [Iamia sp.]
MDHERWLEIKADHLGQRTIYMDRLLPAVLVNTVHRNAFPGQLVSFHKARYKDVTRLKEKLMRVEEDEQIELHTGNYRDMVSDHLGVRFITLLLEDRASVVAAIDSLAREGVIEILKSKEIRSFARMDYAAQDPTPETVEVHEGGYSSHHFALRLLSSDAEWQGLSNLVFELQ